MKNIFFLLVVIYPLISFSQAHTVETVPNNKLANGSYVSNPDAIVNTSTTASIDSLLADLERRSTAQVAVVLLNSIGDDDIFEFSQRLFGKWGIGRSQNDNGLLIVLVKDKHTIRFHTGNGLEGVLPDAVCKRIQVQKMLPSFREDDYDGGMLAGVTEVYKILSNPQYAQEIVATGDKEEEVPMYGLVLFLILLWLLVTGIIFLVKKRNKKFFQDGQEHTTPDYHLKASTWAWRFIALPIGIFILAAIADHAGVLFGGMYVYIASMLVARKVTMDKEADHWLSKREYQSVYNFYQERKGLFNVMRFFFPVPLMFLYPAYKKRMQFFRDHPRNCKHCEASLSKLDEKADDVFLSSGQLKEEELRSVDYDVWHCGHCKNYERLMYVSPNTKYEACPKCKFYALKWVSDRTIQSATEYSEGTGEEIKECKFCQHRNVRTYSIPKITRSSSSSGGSSSSSGGSWGGGRSSGGGASSSW
jgi:uncharacterized protein